MSVLSLDISGSQIDGARDYQEDAFLITHLGDQDADTAGSMIIVADGMGGHAAGNVASNMAVQTFNRHLSKNFPSASLSTVLYEAVLQANSSITATVAETAALKGMGCTLVACVIERGNLRWASVGDSHLYLLRGGQLTKKNADHSYGGFLDRMAEAGTPVDAEAGFSRNMLMSALTGDDIAEIDCPEVALTLGAGDRVILSSDGLDTLTSEQIIAMSAASPSAKSCVEALLQAVTDAGAPRQDNTTVIVVDVLEKAELSLEPAVAPKVTAAAPPEDPEKARPAVSAGTPYLVENPPARKFPVGLLIGGVLAFAVLGGGAYWYTGTLGSAPTATTSAGPSATAPATPPTDDDTLVELEAVKEEPLTPGKVAPQAAPAPVAATASAATAPAREGTFRDGLKSGGQGPLMAWLPPGKFTMGNPISTDPAERPQACCDHRRVRHRRQRNFGGRVPAFRESDRHAHAEHRTCCR